MQYAMVNACALLTFNYGDFEELHYQVLAQGRTHHGVLIVRREDDAEQHKNMRPADIVRAISNLEASGVPIAGHLHNLNAWQ